MIYKLPTLIHDFCVSTLAHRPHKSHCVRHVLPWLDPVYVVSPVGMFARGYACQGTADHALRRLHQEQRRQSKPRWYCYTSLPTMMALCPSSQDAAGSSTSRTTLESRHPP